MMSGSVVLRRSLLLGFAALVAGCARTFVVAYAPVAGDEAKSWTVRNVRVQVPAGLAISEQNSWIPAGDIVWHGDPTGDRRAQVASILKEGVSQGVSGLHGPRSVVLDIQLTRFHALTPLAYSRAPSGTGVHSIGFYLTVRDAKTAEIVVATQKIEADMPATVAADDTASLSELSVGARQKSEIIRQIARVIRGWAGTGPDVRTQFVRAGG